MTGAGAGGAGGKAPRWPAESESAGGRRPGAQDRGGTERSGGGRGPDGARPAGRVTDEEMRALLGPLEPGRDPEGMPVLLVADRLEDQDRIVDFLRSAGISSVAARNGYVALDLLRVGRFRALVLAAAALPPNAADYVARARSVNTSLPICLIREPGEAGLTVEAYSTTRPLTERALRQLFPFLDVPTPVPSSGSDAFAAAPGSSEAAGRPEDGDASRGAGNSRVAAAVALSAAKAALEARLGGRSLRDGLRLWAAEEPSILGLVELREAQQRTVVEAVGPKPPRGREMIGLLLSGLGKNPGGGERARSVGPFSVFAEDGDVESLLALGHADQAEGESFLDQFSPFLPLLDQVVRRTDEPETEARRRFMSFLESRMCSVERIGGRLGILLLRCRGVEAARTLTEGLRQVLRGGDWVETVGPCAYVVLDQPNQEAFSALGARLRGLPGTEGLRVAALGWTPDGGSAEELLARAEDLLEKGRPGQAVPGLGGAAGEGSSSSPK